MPIISALWMLRQKDHKLPVWATQRDPASIKTKQIYKTLLEEIKDVNNEKKAGGGSSSRAPAYQV
jgi:hypothetical protein